MIPFGAERAVKAQLFRCRECAAEMKFDAGRGLLKCDHCGATRPVPTDAGKIAEYDFAAGLVRTLTGLGTSDATRVARCQECGANVVFADGVTATMCTFCGSSKVLAQAENKSFIRPESLVPFAIDRQRRNQAFSAWLDKLWFRPSDLKRMARVHAFAGVYVPFWIYDAHAESSWTAEVGTTQTETETHWAEENGQQVLQQKHVETIRWESASGHRADDLEDVLVCASVGLPRELADRLSTFDLKKLVPYAPEFLAGWRAEEYAIDLQAGFGYARSKMDSVQTSRCSQDVPGTQHRSLHVSSTFSAIKFKHALLPVWIAAYRYDNQVFRFLINGQTGEVVGKAPWSWRKITLLVLLLLLGFGALLLAGYLQRQERQERQERYEHRRPSRYSMRSGRSLHPDFGRTWTNARC